jgi:transcriptional regulator with XRE-family HTH domain
MREVARQQQLRRVAQIMNITARQAAAARAALGMTRDELAAAAKVGARTIVDFERGAREPIHSTRAALRAALEARGATFTPDGGVSVTGEALATLDARKGEAGGVVE